MVLFSTCGGRVDNPRGFENTYTNLSLSTRPLIESYCHGNSALEWRRSRLSLNITAALEARATANEWLISHLPDRFAAGIPEYDDGLAGWRIAVWLAYPGLEPLGPMGDLIV